MTSIRDGAEDVMYGDDYEEEAGTGRSQRCMVAACTRGHIHVLLSSLLLLLMSLYKIRTFLSEHVLVCG